MQLLKSYSLLLLLLMLGTSCNFLDETSPNDVPFETAITDAASAKAALNGCYATLQSRSYYGGHYVLLGDGLTDIASTGGYQVISLDQIGKSEVTPTNLIVQDMWVAIYKTINQCNFVLEGLTNAKDLKTAERNHIEAEARTLRAMAHFDALRYFGEHWNVGSEYGVPIIEKVQNLGDKSTRATVGANYTFIINELQAALPKLDTLVTPQYISRSTVNALLARVYLYRKTNDKAAENATTVIQNKAYALLAANDYPSVFSNRRTSESIFELAFSTQNRSDFNAMTYARDDAKRPELNYLAEASLNTFFKTRPNDVRSLMLNFNAGFNDNTITPDGRTEKYRGEDTKDNPAYILRLAEMYLIRAEARGRLNGGIDDLNYLRQARGLDSLKWNDVDTDVKFQKILLDERRAELNFEGHRYFDLARTRLLKAVLEVADFRSILPIPQREMEASSGAYKQNVGY
jgi:starch-binding outer membrane protein, SusD/RagB family